MADRFDWYQATVEEPPLWLRQALQDGFSGSEWVDLRPRQGYARCTQLVRDSVAVLELLDGGRHEWPHVVATGSTADDAAQLLRTVAPDHLVARADVCVDLVSPDWFERAFAVMVDVAKTHRVKPKRDGNWDVEPFARTLYLGAPTSAVRLRLYEKGQQLLQQHGELAAEVVPADWSRLEVQVRPAKRSSKQAVAQLAPDRFWGCSRFSRDVAAQLLGSDAPRLAVGTVHRAQQLERSEFFMLKQYGNHLRALRDVHGSWPAVGEYLGQCLEAMKKR